MSEKSAEYSLESILADVKGSAFIDGETKTPSTILEAEAERILREASASQLTETTADKLISEAYEKLDKPEIYSENPFAEPEFSETTEIPMIISPPEDQNIPQNIPQKPQASAMLTGIDFSSKISSRNVINEEAGYSVDAETENEFESIAKAQEKRRTIFDRVIVAENEEFGREPDEEELFEEPRLKDKAVKYARNCNSISRRLLSATSITLIMVIITFAFEADMIIPFGIGTDLTYTAGALIILLLIVMMLCIEIIIRGVDFLIQGKPNAESLILFSCVLSLLSATFTILSGTAQMLPFCAVSALSLLFAAYGERTNLRAMTDSLKTAISSAEPYGVQAQYNENLDKTVLKKSFARTDGFYTNMVGQDISETLYQFVAPVLLLSSLVVTGLYILLTGSSENSLHVLSALLAASAPFSALIAYALPYGIISKATARSGAAIAGWGGADDISHTDGACVTDDDMFPEGTLKLSAVKVFDGAPKSNVLCYTGSLIIASGSGLSGLFSEALKEMNIVPLRVADFECHESGVSAIVQGHRVATGSAAHMNLVGVRVPDDSNLRNAVFTAVNGRLVAMFTIEYHPLPAVQKALISILKWRIDLFFAMRDFNITPSMVGQKFKVPFESFVFMPVKETYAISDPYLTKEGRMAAVLVHESLKPYAEAITGARLMRSAAFAASILSVISACIGFVIMFVMMWSGSFLSASPGNLIIYGLCMLAAVLLVCSYTKIRK